MLSKKKEGAASNMSTSSSHRPGVREWCAATFHAMLKAYFVLVLSSAF